MKAWHFIRPNLTLGYHDRRTVIVGEEVTYIPPCTVRSQYLYRCPARWCPEDITTCLEYKPQPLTLCKSGLHASKSIYDAYRYAKDDWILTEVELGGKIIEGDDKIVAEKRTVLWNTGLSRKHLEQVWLEHLNKGGKQDYNECLDLYVKEHRKIQDKL